MNKLTWISQLHLEPHIEGGYFRRTYQSQCNTLVTAGSRPLMSSIYYMLTDDSPIGYFHRNQSDIIHYWHAGEPVHYSLISPAGVLEHHVLGPGHEQQLQLTVPGGHWKASQLKHGEFGLLSEAVCPGFEYLDMELATADQMQSDFYSLFNEIKHLIKP